MKLLYRRCAGLDVHKNSVTVCVRRRVSGSSQVEMEEAVFATFTQELRRLGAWLKQHKVKHVAMESTGVYWIPVWNVLEGRSLSLTLVNPATVRALQGRKTDRIDARRIAEYMQYGLLGGSFVPPKAVRQWRELTRMRVHVQQDRNRVINRIARQLETVNISCHRWHPTSWARAEGRCWPRSQRADRHPNRWRIRRSASCGQKWGRWFWLSTADPMRTFAGC